MEIIYNIESIEDLNTETLAAYLRDFTLNKRPNLIKLKDYYKNKTAISSRTKPETYMPNNKVPTNFQRYITDIETGYFLGDPIKYDAPKAPNLLNYLIDINKRSSEGSHNAKLSKEASKTGVAYELIYLNDSKEIKLATLPSENTFIIRDTTIEENVLAAINLNFFLDYTTGKEIVKVNVYTDKEIKTYSYVQNKLTYLQSKLHYINGVPILEYRNSDEAIGSYEDHIATLDAYNLITSDSVNDIEQFANAILVIAADNLPEDEEITDGEGNVVGVKKFADTIRVTRTVVMGQGDTASFLHKPTANVGAFTLMEKLKANLLMLTGVPDFGEGLAGNLSAAAIKNALFAFEQRLKNKENNFKISLDNRLRLLTDLINFKYNTSFNYVDVNYVFTLNAPDSFTDSITFAEKTDGLLSKQTRISKLVKDPQAELDLIKAEKESESINLEVDDSVTEETTTNKKSI